MKLYQEVTKPKTKKTKTLSKYIMFAEPVSLFEL